MVCALCNLIQDVKSLAYFLVVHGVSMGELTSMIALWVGQLTVSRVNYPSHPLL